MNKSIISLAIAASLIASMPAQAEDVKVKWFGYGQITAKQGDGLDPGAKKATGPVFGADRVRFGFKIKDGKVFGKLQADLNKTGTDTSKNTLPQIIKDIEAGYKFADAAKLKVGQFKTPIGMDFNTSGKKLDITQRGMEKRLVTERAVGIMLSGRKIIGGLGYDVFYGNAASRGAAYAGGKAGDDNSMAVRGMWDSGRMLHVELGYAIDENSAAEDYEVLDLGFRMKMAAITVKAEYIAGTSVKGVKDADETVWYLHFGLGLGKKIELIGRHYQADQDAPGGGSASLANTYLGANFFLGSNKTNGRVQVDYVVASGDTKGEYTGAAAKAGYVDDVILAQYQVSF